MVLSAANVQWLKQLPGAVAQDDLDVAYGFAHPLNRSRELAKEILSKSGDDEHLLWWIKIFNADQEQVLDAPLARRVYASTQLRSVPVRANGPVVYNALFKIKDAHKRQGFAKNLYAAEGQLYQKWKLREIHIDARDDGLVVWVKHFGFQPRFPKVLRNDYIAWARRHRRDAEPPARPEDYPEDFLRSRDSLELYKEIR